MLTEADKKWLKEKQARSVMCYTFRNCGDCPYKETCYLWPNDYKDAAEFEARVAAKLATMTCDRFCPDVLNNKICRRGWADRRPMYTCRIKHARLLVEQEMEK